MDKRKTIIDIVEKNDISDKEIGTVVKSWVDNEKFNIRKVKIPNEREKVDSERVWTKSLSNRANLIKRVLELVQSDLKDFENVSNLKEYYNSKGMQDTFNLSRNELRQLFELNEYDIYKILEKEHLKEDYNLSEKDIVDFIKDDNIKQEYKLNEEEIYKDLSEEDNLFNNVKDILDTMIKSTNYNVELIGSLNWEHILGPFYPIREDEKKRPGIRSEDRIYINSPKNNNTEKFLNEYIYECAKKKLPYTMKGIFDSDYKDGTILYTTDHFLIEHLECLEKASKKCPNIIKTFGEPPCLTGIVPELETTDKKWFGLSHHGGGFRTYNDFINDNVNLAIVHTILKQSDNENYKKMLEEQGLSKSVIKNFINLENVLLHEYGSFYFEFEESFEIHNVITTNKKIFNEFINKQLSNPITKKQFLDQFKNSLKNISLMKSFGENSQSKIPTNVMSPCISSGLYKIYEEEKNIKKGLGNNIKNASIKDKCYNSTNKDVALKKVQEELNIIKQDEKVKSTNEEVKLNKKNYLRQATTFEDEKEELKKKDYWKQATTFEDEKEESKKKNYWKQATTFGDEKEESKKKNYWKQATTFEDEKENDEFER